MSTKTATIDPERQMLGEVEVIGRDRWEEIRRRAGAEHDDRTDRTADTHGDPREQCGSSRLRGEDAAAQ